MTIGMLLLKNQLEDAKAEIQALRTELSQIKMAEIEAKPKSYRVKKAAKKIGITKSELIDRLKSLGWVGEKDGEITIRVPALTLGWAELQDHGGEFPRLRITDAGIIAIVLGIQLNYMM